MNGIGKYERRKKRAPLFVVLGCVLLLAAGALAVWLLPGAEGLRSRITGIFGEDGVQSGEESLSQEETLSDDLIWQSEPGAEDDCTAVFTTDAGAFTVKLKPESAAAAEFAELAKAGAFDGMTIDRSVEGRYLQTSIVSGDIPEEETGLAPIYGAVGFVSQDGETSLFFVTTDSLTAESSAFVAEQGFGAPVAQLYADQGGVPELSGVCTVFGQTVSGSSLLRTAAAAETSGWTAGYMLTTPVTVLSIEIIEPVLPEEASSE